jgi:hypothetical protein
MLTQAWAWHPRFGTFRKGNQFAGLATPAFAGLTRTVSLGKTLLPALTRGSFAAGTRQVVNGRPAGSL